MQGREWGWVAILLCISGILLSLAALDDTVSDKRSCFPAEAWGADDEERPCAEIVNVWEDGSVKIEVTTAGGQLRYTANVGALDQ